MKRVTLEIQDTKDFNLLMQLAERLHIKTEVDEHELSESELTLAGMKLSEKSLAEDWEGEDDEYWNSLLKK